MATTDFDDEPDAPAPGAMNDTLNQFRQQFTDPDARAWADETATRLDDYVQRKQISDAATAAGDNFVNNLDQFKSGLVNMVQKDPFAVDTALSLVRPTVGVMVNNVAGHPPEQLADQHEQISTHIEQTIAGAAVRSMAEQHEDTARSMLDKVGGLLDDGDRQALDGYIGVQARARDLDAAAQQRQQAQQQSITEQNTSLGYLGALVHPDTGQVQFPPGWAQRVLSDQRVGPQASAQLIDTYGRLWKDGDVQSSNPLLVHQVAQQIASDTPPQMSELMFHIGRGMTAADALTLSYGAQPGTEDNKDERNQLAATLDAAKRTLAPPENGPAGMAAFEKFTDWLMPAYRKAGPGALNPQSPNYLFGEGDDQDKSLFWKYFAPRLDDVVNGQVPGAADRGIARMYGFNKTQDGITLDDIFNRGRGAPAGDTVEKAPRIWSGRQNTIDGIHMGDTSANPDLIGRNPYPYNKPRNM